MCHVTVISGIVITVMSVNHVISGLVPELEYYVCISVWRDMNTMKVTVYWAATRVLIAILASVASISSTRDTLKEPMMFVYNLVVSQYFSNPQYII